MSQSKIKVRATVSQGGFAGTANPASLQPLSISVRVIDEDGHWVNQPDPTSAQCSDAMRYPRRYFGCVKECPKCEAERKL